MRPLLFLALLAASLSFPRLAAAQNFALPIDCPVGSVCIVQNYADWSAGRGAATDPMCGALTYPGHDGLDFRAPAMRARAGVAVLAPAAGVVLRIRDGEADGAFLRGGETAIGGRDCGNGVVIDHGNGWESQLCHFRTGSVRVSAGARVTAGQAVGLVGLSGHTQFPHVHLTLRHNGQTVDPITGGVIGAGACGANAVRPGPQWSSAARTALAYHGTQWFEAGFTGSAPPQGVSAEEWPVNASRQSAALVFWGLATGPRNGDVLRVRLYGPNGAVLADSTRTQPRDQAQAWAFAGKRTPTGGWPAGAYRGEAALLRGGHVVQTRTETLQLR